MSACVVSTMAFVPRSGATGTARSAAFLLTPTRSSRETVQKNARMYKIESPLKFETLDFVDKGTQLIIVESVLTSNKA